MALWSAACACLCLIGAAQTKVTTTPHSCTKDNLPYQVITLAETFEMHSWDWISGERSVHWSHKKSDFPQIRGINACGISPEDSIAYCICSGHLVRVDKDGFAFVARTPRGRGSVSAGFDEDGTFWATAGLDVWKLEAPHSLVGYAESAPTLPELTTVGQTESVHGADIVVWECYLVSVAGGKVVVTDSTDRNLRTFLPAATADSDSLPVSGFGGAYMYSGRMFFSANGGAGVFKVDLDLVSVTYTAMREGESSDDGLNCILTEAPETTSADVKDSAGRGSVSCIGAAVFAGLLHL